MGMNSGRQIKGKLAKVLPSRHKPEVFTFFHFRLKDRNGTDRNTQLLFSHARFRRRFFVKHPPMKSLTNFEIKIIEKIKST